MNAVKEIFFIFFLLSMTSNASCHNIYEDVIEDVIKRMYCNSNTDSERTIIIEEDSIFIETEPFAVKVSSPECVNIKIGISETPTDSAKYDYCKFTNITRFENLVIISAYMGDLQYGREYLIDMSNYCEFYYKVKKRDRIRYLGYKEK